MNFRAWRQGLQGKAGKGMLPLLALIVFQALCAVVFLLDLVKDVRGLAQPGLVGVFNAGLLPELAATLGLVIGIVIELRLLRHLLQRNSEMEAGLAVAAGALSQVMDGYFRGWSLTPAERDVATFTIKGFSIAEIAQLRGSAEGTIKTHLNAIYRKSGLAGRTQLICLMVEDLMRAPLPPVEPEVAPVMAAQ